MFEEIKERLEACPPLKPYATAKGGVVIFNSPFPIPQASGAVAFIAAAKDDILALLEQVSERDRIIDDLQADRRGMEQKIAEDGRRIAGLEDKAADFRDKCTALEIREMSLHATIARLDAALANSQQIGNVTAANLMALQDEYKALEVAHDNKGLGVLALAEKRGQTITELVNEKIALLRQLEDAQAYRDSHKAGFDATNIALKHTEEQVEQLQEQLNYAQATILKQAQRMAKLGAELRDLKAAGQ